MSSKEATEQTQLINNEAYTAGEYFYFINVCNINVFNVRYEVSEFVTGKRGVLMRCVSSKGYKKTLTVNRLNKNKGAYHITKNVELADISYHKGNKNKDL
jgi:hypothetical protein